MIEMPTSDEPVRVIHGDCLDVLPLLPRTASIISDPPWGINANTDYTRFSGGLSPSRDYGTGIIGDSLPFDPSPWLTFRKVALWGANCFAQHLPVGRWLVWLKKRESQIGTFMSDAELCWVNKPPGALRAPGVYVKRHVWHGFDRESERGKCLHPTQKPVELMKWTIEMAEVPVDGLVIDPYGGVGATALACLATGRRCILIEKDATYATIARKRVAAAMQQTGLLSAV